MNSHSRFKILNSKFFLSVLLIFLLLAPAGFSFAAQRALEIVYPSIPGEPAPTTVDVSLPEYAQYIFRLAVWVIGFIIFGVLIYNGIIYMTSSGNPAKLGEAKSGIFAAILGTAILIGAYLIFTTINPQLVHLKTEPLKPLLGIVGPGIYVCDDGGKAEKEGNISKKIADYINFSESENPEDADKQIEVVKEIREIMSKYGCPRLSFSGNFQNFSVKKDKNTFFSVPDRRREENKWIYDVYNYGLILHQKDRHGGMAELVRSFSPTEQNIRVVYGRILSFPNIDFTAKSFTVFEKVATEPSSDSKGVILYACLNYNEPPIVCENKGDEQISAPFSAGRADITHYNSAKLGKLAENTRSIQIDPAGSYFAILFRDENFTGRGGINVAEVFSGNDRNLQDNDIGRCGAACYWTGDGSQKIIGRCSPCLKSMIVIKGRVQ